VLAVVDAGLLYAVTDTDDEDHERSLAVLQRPDLQLVIPTLVVVALAERLGTDVVISLDRRHFGAVQPRHRRAFQLLPD
jgi:uncharacterized protein